MLLLLLCGCPPRFDGTVYRGDGFAFRIPPIPRTWQRLSHSHGSLAFRDAEHAGSVLLNGRCGLDGDDVPLKALTGHLFLQFTEREVVAQEVVPFDGREAMHTTMKAKLDGVPMMYDVWVLKKDGCVYDLLYLAPERGFGAGRAAFQRLIWGFSTVNADGNDE